MTKPTMPTIDDDLDDEAPKRRPGPLRAQPAEPIPAGGLQAVWKSHDPGEAARPS
jgi:hypothetical protein